MTVAGGITIGPLGLKKSLLFGPRPSPDLVLVMSFDDLVLLLPVRRIAAFRRRIAVFDRHPLVGVDGFQVGGLSCGALLLDSIGERDIIGKGTTCRSLELTYSDASATVGVVDLIGVRVHACRPF